MSIELGMMVAADACKDAGGRATQELVAEHPQGRCEA